MGTGFGILGGILGKGGDGIIIALVAASPPRVCTKEEDAREWW